MSFDRQYLETVIQSINDWPEPGVIFRDVSPIFKTPKAMRMICEEFTQRYLESDITHIASIDARGFIFGSVVAYQLNIPMVLIRKKGKLPGETIAEDYQLEYGRACVEMQKDALDKNANVVIFDDLVATGGTVLASISLIKRLGANVKEVAALIDLPDLQGSSRIEDANIPVYSILAYSGK